MKAIRKRVIQNFVEINGVTVSHTELLELLSALDGTDGMFTAVTIHDDRLVKILVDEGIADKNVRGSHYCKDEKKRAAIVAKLEDLDFGSSR